MGWFAGVARNVGCRGRQFQGVAIVDGIRDGNRERPLSTAQGGRYLLSTVVGECSGAFEGDLRDPGLISGSYFDGELLAGGDVQ